MRTRHALHGQGQSPTSVQKFAAALTLFLGGWNSTVPIAAATGVPAFFQPLNVLPGLPLEQLLLLAALPTIGFGRSRTAASRGGQIAAVLLSILGFLGIVSNLLNEAPLNEMGEAMRHIGFAAFLGCYWSWTSAFGIRFAIAAVVAGLAAGGAVNIGLSIAEGQSFVGTLPLLFGQAGPGSSLGLLTVLSAWSFALADHRAAKIAAAAAGAIGCCGAVMSFSKIGLLMSGAGVIAWACVAFADPRSRGLATSALVVAIVLASLAGMQSERVRALASEAISVLTIKFSPRDLDITDDNSDIRGSRLLFWPAVAQIVWNHPLAGVGYAGFASAYKRTEVSSDPRAYEEAGEGPGSSDSNPHCTILYYASANGVPGFVIAVGLLLVIQQTLWRACRRVDPSWRPIGWALAGSMLLWSMTLPDMYESTLILSIVGVASTAGSVATQARRRHQGGT